VAWGLTGDDDTHGLGASIHCLMALAGRDFDAFISLKDEVVVFDFESQFSFDDVEKLARVDVGVTDFAGAGRHELFDDAEFGSFDEVPAIAVGSLWASPLVVFGRIGVDDAGGHVSHFL
jgi:hypothetical protein